MRSIRAVDRVEKTKVISMLCEVGKELADLNTALSVVTKPPGRTKQRTGLGELNSRLVKRKLFACVLLESWLEIERVDVRRPTFHEQENHALRTRWNVRCLGGKWCRVRLRVRWGTLSKDGRESDVTKANRGLAQDATTGNVRLAHWCGHESGTSV